MTNAAFNTLVHKRTQKIAQILSHKAKEYARGDRLSNFKKAAVAMSCTPEKACAAFWMKHVISINDLVNDIERGESVPDTMWQEKIGDAINYLILLEALTVDRGSNA